jgi:hypothetical protein
MHKHLRCSLLVQYIDDCLVKWFDCLVNLLHVRSILRCGSLPFARRFRLLTLRSVAGAGLPSRSDVRSFKLLALLYVVILLCARVGVEPVLGLLL